MDYKKKYEEAVKKLKKFFTDNDDRILYKHDIETVFPELKESENERIKEAITKTLKRIPSREIECFGVTKDSVYAWLEKQGEQKSTNKVEPKFKVGDMIHYKYDDREFTIKTVDLDKGTYTYTQEGCGNDIDYADEEFELVEQNPAWSEEDENYCLDVNVAVDNYFDEGYAEELRDWLKSLKERMKGE